MKNTSYLPYIDTPSITHVCHLYNYIVIVYLYKAIHRRIKNPVLSYI